MIIKSLERNIRNVYEVWKLLCGPNASTGLDPSTRVAAKAVSPGCDFNDIYLACYEPKWRNVLAESFTNLAVMNFIK